MSIRISNKTIALAVFLIIIGLLTILTPWYLLPVCEAAGKDTASMSEMHTGKAGMPMKCAYTARAEAGAGALVVLLGLTLLILPGRDSRKAVGINTIGVGTLIVLLPFLIGVCGSSSAPCVIGTKPGLILLGSITILIGAILALTRDLRDGAYSR